MTVVFSVSPQITLYKADHYICRPGHTCHVRGAPQSCVCTLGSVRSDEEPSFLIPKSLFQEGEKRLGKCSAQVFFRNEKPRPAINVTCTQLVKKEKRQEEDYQLYKLMKQLKSPLNAVSIPGIYPSLEFLYSGMSVITKSQEEWLSENLFPKWHFNDRRWFTSLFKQNSEVSFSGSPPPVQDSDSIRNYLCPFHLPTSIPDVGRARARLQKRWRSL